MSRAPVYHEKNADFRIVSFPNGEWQYQRNTHKQPDDRRREIDPWAALARPCPYNTAKAQLDTLTPT